MVTCIASYMFSITPVYYGHIWDCHIHVIYIRGVILTKITDLITGSGSILHTHTHTQTE